MKIRRIISRSLIIVGSLLVLGALATEAMSFPWNVVFGKSYEQELAALPDPPVPDYAVLPEAKDPASDPGDGEPAEEPSEELPAALPDDGGLLPVTPTVPKVKYTLLGVLKIPKLSVSVNIYEGAERGQLAAGVGYIKGGASLGGEGNASVAGHRNLISRRPFRYLNMLGNGDKVVVKAEGKLYTYEVFESFIVAPEDVWVLGKVEGESHVLTLITCDPVMNPVNRLIVRARLVETAEA